MQNKQLAKELREILIDKYNSIDSAAKALNLSVGYLYQILNGAAPITIKYLKKLRDMGVTSKFLEEQILISEKRKNEKMAVIAKRKHIIRVDGNEVMLFRTLRKHQKKVPSNRYKELIQRIIKTIKEQDEQ